MEVVRESSDLDFLFLNLILLIGSFGIVVLGVSGSELGGIGGWMLLESNRIRVLLNLLGFFGLQANCGAGGNFLWIQVGEDCCWRSLETVCY